MPPKFVQREPCQRRRRSLCLSLAYRDLPKRSFSPLRSMRNISWTWSKIELLSSYIGTRDTYFEFQVVSMTMGLDQIVLQLLVFVGRALD